MSNQMYKEGLTLSQEFEKRSQVDTIKLYEIIKFAIIKALDATGGKEQQKAIDFLADIYKPYLRKISSKVYQNLKGHLEYADVIQETYAMFLTLLSKYNAATSAFSYYISVMLPQHMNRWAERELLYKSMNVLIDVREYSVIDPKQNSTSSVEDSLNSFILSEEYREFIMARAEKQSRSSTVKEVCHRYFLGKCTCSSIADDLGISYHAVYEIIGKIKVELKEFFFNNQFSNYYISSSGYIEVR